MLFSWILLTTAATATAATALQVLPPVNWTSTTTTTDVFKIANAPPTVYVSSSSAAVRDTDGITLIPPSTLEFANTFAADLLDLFGREFTVQVVDEPPSAGVYLTILPEEARGGLEYESGQATTEGYELEISGALVQVKGAGARGAWWGTRTLLQSLVVGDGTVKAGKTRDAPAVSTRGFMLDAGRKWYSLGLLKELCTYASFFKFSEFQYHASDNYPLNRGRNETWSEVYSQFSLLPEDESLLGLIARKNETLSRMKFADFQRHCAQRGITVIPEIESPGHALAITKWMPQLALAKKDLLNLTHPETIPTVKKIWNEFLPWFMTKEVHIGADEYDATLADVYIAFVNEMAAWVKEVSGKRVRIWGTNEPSTTMSVSKDIVIQHWQYGESDPVLLEQQGYDVINSEDWWGYVSIKNDHTPILPRPYPQHFDTDRTLNFAGVEGWQWEPRLVNPFNTSEEWQIPQGSKRLRGATMASWNDNGPDASTQLEAYYAWREGMPVVGARAWSGSRGPLLDTSTLAESVARLATAAPGQNLDRRIPALPVSWNGTTPAVIGLGSKGMNYTLTISYTAPFTLSSLPDANLTLLPSGELHFIADGTHYPLRSTSSSAGYDAGHPGRIWSNDTSSSHEAVLLPSRGTVVIRTDEIGGSRVWAGGEDEEFLGRFEAFVYGGRNTVTSWSQMAFVAPMYEATGDVVEATISEGV
ncbi:putative beta-N-hexosaminidase [Tricharina praecox]|uniref:putative beta-N-hexosaminidase n=1 Tax=Tricharina praecox TaxID=43433 RepID=UPI00221F2EBD|nr:putative beta-N-hexosaminidase [Tricharina praecox]KAI5843263.1 putative beta-N-hexosaminidase [Tricharina praecox]